MEPQGSASPRHAEGDAAQPLEAGVAGVRVTRYKQFRDKSTGRYIGRGVVETLPPRQVLVEARTIYLPPHEEVDSLEA